MIKIFTSSTCAPCRVVYTMLKNRTDIIYVSIDTDEGLAEAQSYGVSSTPTLLNDDLSIHVGLEQILKNLKV